MNYIKKIFLVLLTVILIPWFAGCEKKEATPPMPATISPESGAFGVQPTNYKDLEITLDPGGYVLKEIVCENDMIGPDGKPFSKALTENTDYVKNGDVYIILKEFLKTLSDNTLQFIVFKMDGGDNNPSFTVNMVPDESGFTIDWMLMSLSPDDAVRTQQIGNQISMTSEYGLDYLIKFYEDALEYFFTAEINPQYEADWWYAVKSGKFIYTVYLQPKETETNIIITFYLEEFQPE